MTGHCLNARWRQLSSREYCEKLELRPHVLSWAHLRNLPRDVRDTKLNGIVDEQGRLPTSDRESLDNMADALVRNSIPSGVSIISPFVTQSVSALSHLYAAFPSIDSLQWSCTVDEVEQMCAGVNVHTAQGCDNIHPCFLRYGGRALFQALHSIFVYSYRHGVIPDQWTRSIAFLSIKAAIRHVRTRSDRLLSPV